MQSLPYRPGLPQPPQLLPLAEPNASTITIAALNQFLSPLLCLPTQIRTIILTFALGGHHIRIYALNCRVRPRACPECYFGLPYALTLGPAVPVSVLMAHSRVSRQVYLEAQGRVFAQNEFMGYPIPLTALFKRMTSRQANITKKVTVSVLVPFHTLEDNKTVTGLSEEVIEILRTLCGMSGLQKVSVEWDEKHDNHGEAHGYFWTRVMEMFEGYERDEV